MVESIVNTSVLVLWRQLKYLWHRTHFPLEWYHLTTYRILLIVINAEAIKVIITVNTTIYGVSRKYNWQTNHLWRIIMRCYYLHMYLELMDHFLSQEIIKFQPDRIVIALPHTHFVRTFHDTFCASAGISPTNISLGQNSLSVRFTCIIQYQWHVCIKWT